MMRGNVAGSASGVGERCLKHYFLFESQGFVKQNPGWSVAMRRSNHRPSGSSGRQGKREPLGCEIHLFEPNQHPVAQLVHPVAGLADQAVPTAVV